MTSGGARGLCVRAAEDDSDTCRDRGRDIADTLLSGGLGLERIKMSKRRVNWTNSKILCNNQTLHVGAESDQLVNICSFAVRCDRRCPNTQ